MCGRFVRKGEAGKVGKFLGVLHGGQDWTESFNVAPGTRIPIVVPGQAGRRLIPATWGFTAPMPGRPLFNARGETVHRLPTFRESFRSRRCLVPAGGFYEWRRTDRQPHYFERHDSLPMAFAGIWIPGPCGHPHAAIITTVSNREMHGIHHRMPVVLEQARWAEWLGPDALPDRNRLSLLAPPPDGTLNRWPVGREVGDVRNDHPGLLNRIREVFVPELFD